MAAFDVGLARRMLVALAVSIALHVVVLLLVQAKPPAPGQASTPVLRAWIERGVGPAPAEPLSESSISAPETPAPETPSRQVAALDMPATPSANPPTEAPRPSAARQTPAADARPAIEVPALSDPTYYPIGALDRLPMLIGSADVCYPEGATGEVAYLLLIDDSGAVNEASVLDARPAGLFTAAAAESCRGLKFTPASKDGRAVKSRVRFVVGPRPTGSAPSP